MKLPRRHNKNPEETYANYNGYSAIKAFLPIHRASEHENINDYILTKNFIDDYSNYLRKTYRKSLGGNIRYKLRNGGELLMAKNRIHLDEISPGKIYIVQPNDTLYAISKKLTGDGNNFVHIAANNKIENPDDIKVGQQLIIPDKFEKPLDISEIPTRNRVNIIDNYSPNYDYIVEGDKIYYARKGRKDYWVDISDNDVARKNLYSFLHDNYNFRGYEDNEQDIYNKILDGTYLYSDRSKRKKLSSPSRKFSLTMPLNVVQKPSSLQYDRKNALSNFNVDNNTILDDISDLYNKGINYISRQWDKQIGDSDNTSKLIPQQVITSNNSNYNIIPATYTGDTVSVNGRQYIIPESVDLTNARLGVRNRGDYTPINSEAALITNFNPYNKAKNHKNEKGTFMGVDALGQFKIGPIGDFADDDLVTRTFENELVSFAKDTKGNQRYKDDAVHGNRGRSVPIVNMLVDGKIKEGSLNILTDKKQRGNTYGNITGGRLVVKAGNEIRLISGSIDDIEKQIEDIKTRHNTKTIKVYTLDNGSYNRGLRTKDRRFTAKDLRGYDNQNSGGGNFMYLLPNQSAYSSDTIRTPNIRTKNSESYKKGHSLTNSLEGVVLHHTAFMDDDLQPVTNHLTNPNSEASSHVIIGYNGHRRVLAEPEQVTFHGGYSRFNNKNDVNDFMLGIEFQGDTNKKDLTDSQINSAIEYLLPIIRKNNIPIENITTHQEVRRLYNEYQRSIKGKEADNKPDINFTNYQKILKALKNKVYYPRSKYELGGTTRFRLRNGGKIPPTAKNETNIDWDKIDKYADYADAGLGLANLGTAAAALINPNPYTIGANKVASLLGAGVDGYQMLRALYNKNYGDAAMQGLETGLSIGGNKMITLAPKFLEKANAGQKVVRHVGRRYKHRYVTTKGKDNMYSMQGVGGAFTVAGNTMPMRVFGGGGSR
jgi:LysM repeat protein